MSNKMIEIDCRAIDIRLMTCPVLENDLRPGERYTMFYNNGKNKAVLVEVKHGSVIYKSGVETFAGFREYARQEIKLSQTKCHYGGFRTWFVCPDCGNRKVILYWKITNSQAPELEHEKLLCRICHGLVFASERRDRGRGDLNRAERLYEKAGGKYGPRPKYMRQKTYDRLRQQAKYYENRHTENPRNKSVTKLNQIDISVMLKAISEGLTSF